MTSSQLAIASPVHRRRGYLGAIARSDDALLAVGGTGNDTPTVLASSDARRFHARAQLDYGLRGACWHDGAWFVVGEYGWCARSTDDGATWTQLATGTRGCLFSVVPDGDGLWIAGDAGYLARIERGADTARSIDAGVQVRICGVVQAAGAWWVLGADGTLAQLEGTKVAPPVWTADGALTDLAETPSGALLVTGDHGLLARSTDDGETWTVIDCGVAEALEAVACLADGTLLVAGGGATLLASRDDGETFAAVEHELDLEGSLWTIEPFGEGALIGGEHGLVLRYGPPGDAMWAERADRFRVDHPLDAVFAPGPDGFVGDRLRAYVVAVNPRLQAPAPAPAAPAATPADDNDTDEPSASAEEAWQQPAMRYAAELWTGTTRDYQAVWGVPPPPALVAFEQATRGANLYSTFHELRLDVALMAEPPPDKNLFEMLVCNDQLNYLGTGLPEAFAAVTCFGQLGNGDTYHYEVYDHSPAGPRPRAVVFWDHEQHDFSYTFADSLDAVAYLAALCKVDDDGLVSDEVAAAGFAQLRRRVAPSWHFSIEERAPDFERFEPQGFEQARFMYVRALWIIGWLRQDGVVSVDDLAERFLPKLNPVLPPEQLPGRLQAMRGYVGTALYALWRAFLFDEPELDRFLEICRGHAARLGRDAARLVDELRAGRNELGRIRDVRRLLERFRALDLDPRRAAEREAEAARRRAERAARTAAQVAEVATLGDDALVAFAWAHVTEPGPRGAILARAQAAPDQARVREAIAFLAAEGYSRHNQLYRDEEHAACDVIAEAAGPAVQATVAGAALAPGDDDAEDAPALTQGHAWETLVRLARRGRLDARVLPILRARLVPEAIEDGRDYVMRRLLEVLGLARDRAAVAPLVALLAPLPAEGELETALKYDELIADIAIALRRIGDPAAAPALLRFAESPALRMRHARNESALAVAYLAPQLGTRALLDAQLLHVREINDGHENAQALLAYGLVGRARPAEEHAALAQALERAQPMAKSYVEVQLARAVALRMLAGGERDVAALLQRAFTEPSWKDESTVRRRRWALQVYELMPVIDASILPTVFDSRDPELDAEALALLGRLGIAATPPRTLTWFDAAALDEAELCAALADPALGGRHHVARALAAYPSDAARAALEQALDALAARAPTEPGRDLPACDERLAREAVRALRSWPAAPSTLAAFARLLVHPCRDLKDPVLRDPPAEPALAPAMRRVAAEKWGWQEKTARAWLQANDRT